ncbi:cytochrome P450 2J1-like [Branchiostoma lanceolatum]|uniref:cytochrome P450 2J1-like n=1 Tax=Branchiostoma lanceolatum TaxID=7740 RepID=UPI0034530011
MGTVILEEKIQEEFCHFCSALRLLGGNPVDIKNLLENSVSNIICSMTWGKRYEYGDPKFVRLQEISERLNMLFYEFSVLNFFPALRFFPGFRKAHQEWMNLSEEVFNHSREYIDQHGITPQGDVRDIIDAFNKTKQENPGFLSDATLLSLPSALFSAGTETTSNTLLWGLLYLMAYPDVQEKIQAELDEVVGRYRPPAFNDKTNMPYTSATIMEIMRIRHIGPILPHCTSDDTNLLGYDIPAGTTVFFNLWALHMDPARWPDPDKFDPTRFLDESGQLLAHDAFMPFSAGHRRCLGEHMAKMELFLFLASTLQQFTFKLPVGAVPDLHGICNAFLSPRPYDLVAIIRE